MQDGGVIEDLEIKNTNLVAVKDALAFYKANCTTSTNFYASNVIGTISKLYKTEDTLINCTKSKSTPAWFGDENTLILNKSADIFSKSKLINIAANNVKITLKSNLRDDGYMFLLNIYNCEGTEIYDEENKLFPSATLSMGLYIVAFNKDIWNIAKIASNKLGDTI